MPKLPDGQWALYLIICKTPKHGYIGITRNPYKRKGQHQGRWRGGAYFTKLHGVVEMQILATFSTKAAALRAEAEAVINFKADNKDWTVAGSVWCTKEGYVRHKRADLPKYEVGKEPWRKMLDELERHQ